MALLIAPLSGSAASQELPAPVVELSAGWVGFPDDGTVSERLIGGTARWYLSPRISVGPEIVHIQGSGHSHLVATGNLTWDLHPPATGSLFHVTPFVVVGGGVFQTRQTFFTGPFTANEGAFTAGGGVRVLVNNRVTIGAEARIGWELHLRVNGLVGVAFYK
jgi:hypothetical protein